MSSRRQRSGYTQLDSRSSSDSGSAALPPRARSKALRWAAPAALLLLTLLAFAPALRGGWIWDDDAYVTDNAELESLAGLGRIWLTPGATPQYYPLVFTSFWIERQIFGVHPFPFHLANVLLHAGSAVLLWLVLKRVGMRGAWLGAALFAIHPLQVESVAWVTERKNVLGGLFLFASALAWVRARPPEGESSPRLWWTSFLLFAGALLSKTVTAALPVGLFLLGWWKRPREWRRDLVALLPFFALGAAFGLLTAWMEVHHVGAKGVEWNLSRIERGSVAARAFCFYLGKMIWPVRLAFSYSRWTPRAADLMLYLPIAAACLLLPWLLRGRFGRGPIVAMGWYAAALFPALGFLDVYPMRYSWVADHFQYFAAAGPLALLGAGLVRIRPRPLPVLLIALLVVLTFRQSAIYESAETLWTDTLRKNPESVLAHGQLGMLLASSGRDEESLAHFRQALELDPKERRTWISLAAALGRLKRYPESIEASDHAIAIEPADGNAWLNRGVAKVRLGQWQDGADDLAHGFALGFETGRARQYRAIALARLGRYAEASAEAERAVALEPRDNDARMLLERCREEARASRQMP
ncbi:MAG: tetratricopeptide repeat protein [Candidatus Eisenbacteria bacterium]